MKISNFPVSVREYLLFLNSNEIRDAESSLIRKGIYKYANVFNPAGPIEWKDGSFFAKKEENLNHPITCISYLGAIEYAHYRGARLMTIDLCIGMYETLRDEYRKAEKNELLNVGDRYGGPNPVGKGYVDESGYHDMLSNVRTWVATESSEYSTALVFGAGFNKRFGSTRRDFFKKKPKTFGSVSIGVRLCYG